MLEKYKENTGFSLAKKSTIKLIKHWQRIVSHFNVRKLQFNAKFISEDLGDWADYLADEYILEDSRARLCMPSLYSLKAIYFLLLTIPGALIGLQINVICEQNIFVGRYTVYFEVQQNKSLKNIKQNLIQTTRPVYVFSGCRCINDRKNFNFKKSEELFSNRDIGDVIFAHEVTYPQYPKFLQKENIIPSSFLILNEINRLKKLKGFSLKDPSDFCTVHVYVDDTDTQALSAYEPPVYLPNLGY